jgi:hypothetical protein
VARHDGEWYWYPIDRALSGSHPECLGPFIAQIRELGAEGLIESRPDPALGEQGRYWFTEAGWRAAGMASAEPRDTADPGHGPR